MREMDCAAAVTLYVSRTVLLTYKVTSYDVM